jgi:uncharacterized protein (TIGR02271 family)
MARDFTPQSLVGASVTGADGGRIGTVEEVYLDNESGQPEWVSVKTGLFGSHVSLLPLDRASLDGGTVTVPFDESTVKGAPHHDPGVELSGTAEDDLYRYYSVAGASAGTRTDVDHDTTGTAGRVTTSAAGHDTSGPDTDDAVTRSKEELRVGTETRLAGRARLRKYVTSETVSREVPVTHEEVTLTREPITEENRDAALSGGDLTEEEHEVVLTEEHAVAAKETVPVERVQLGTKTVQDTETVQAQVHEEHVEVDDAGATTGGATTREHGPRD